MKLIIDIDDEMVCNDIKNKALEPTSATDEIIINALYNGTPYNPSGDLISREALINDLKHFFTDGVLDGVSARLAFNQILHDIDNAPTVVNENLTPERTQSEWIGNNFDEHHCKSCGHFALWEEEPDGYYEARSNFCPECGAKMKGEEE